MNFSFLRDVGILLGLARRDWAPPPDRPRPARTSARPRPPRGRLVSAPAPSLGWRPGELPEALEGLPRFRKVATGLAISPTVSVVIPAVNEAVNLPAVFASVPAWVDEVVLVDGRSTDDTIAVARRLRPDVNVVVQGGEGKGDARLAGFAAARGDIIVTIDGDGSADGREIVRFVSALLAGADFAKGSRFASAGHSDDITLGRRLGNKILSRLVNAMFGTQYTDLCYGFNAFWSGRLRDLALDCAGFEVETLMGIRAAKARLQIQEIPSYESPRQHGSSNLSVVGDGARILRLIVRERFSSLPPAAHPPGARAPIPGREDVRS
jgi:hypothetical protein